MKFLTLNNNRQIPVVGLGTWRSDTMTVTDAVENAVLRYGYRHIDCAHIYGNEKQIGQAFEKILSVRKIPREELFITSKLWNTHHHPDHVEAACRRTLSDLQLEYLDLYLMHWGIAFAHGGDSEPIGSDGMVKTAPVPIHETWQVMEKLVENGLVKNIGVANFTAPMIVDLLSYARIKPVINQIEIHPYNSQETLIEYCHKQNIQVTAYSPLGSQEEAKKKPIHDTVVIEVAGSHKKTPAQVLIRWALQRDLVVIPKSTNTKHIAENIDVVDFELSNEEMGKLGKLNRNYRFVDPIEWWGIPYFS